ncbi:MAG: peptidoglycan editing factor PgeF [Alphaproteobacteria bacterium]|nr:peptidoglycan editing factor PgeF [Alphaproteobacteria bacterium]
MACPSPCRDSDEIYISADGFAAAFPLFHGFFGRRGGVSRGIYDSLNCGIGSGDDLQAVLKNRQIVARSAGVRVKDFLTLYQEHGDVCLTIGEPWEIENRPRADAMVTDRPGLALGILTADCAPVLFHARTAQDRPLIGVAHAGWRGALKGVLDSTVKALTDLGAQDIKACIGPCIQKRSYEISEEFFETFLRADPENERFFREAPRAGHFLFDLPGYCALRLARAGVGTVAIMDDDTYTREQDFFSHRRATHRKEPDYGRQVAVIAIRA